MNIGQSISQYIKKHLWITLMGVYLLTNILLLTIHGIFGDDINIYRQSEEGIMQQFRGNGALYMGWIHTIMQQAANPILLYRSLIFIIGAINLLLFYAILQKLPLTSNRAFVISLVYAAFPLGYAHMSMICFPYQVGYLLQLLAIYAFVMHYRYRQGVFKWLWLVVYVICQFLACAFLISCAVLCSAMLLIAMIYECTQGNLRDKSFVRSIVLKACLLALYMLPCLAFWYIRSIWFMPTGIYAAWSYNTFSLSNILHYPINLCQSFANCLVGWFANMQEIAAWLPMFGMMILVGFGLYFAIPMTLLDDEVEGKQNRKIWLFGGLLYIAGISAYLLVGQVQEYNTLDDRHGVLLSLAIPILIVAAINCFSSGSVRKVLLVMCMASFICTSWNKYFFAMAEGQKNDAIIAYFESNELPSGNVYVVDETDYFGTTSFCYWSGLYYYATGKQDRLFGVNNAPLYTHEEFRTDMYYQADAEEGESTCLLYVYVDKEKFRKFVLKNVLYRYLKPEKYKRRVLETYLIDRVY